MVAESIKTLSIVLLLLSPVILLCLVFIKSANDIYEAERKIYEDKDEM